MKMNRRNVLAGLGGLAVGGGALLGSGAFSSVEASRDVEVNVLTDIADQDSVADVLFNVGEYSEVGVDGGGGPDSDGTYSPSSSISVGNGYNSGYVSLIENDVTLVFGLEDGFDTTSGDQRLPSNSTVTFENAIAMVQEADSNSDEMTMQFGNADGDPGDFDSTDTDVQILDKNGNLPSGGIEIRSNSDEASGGGSAGFNSGTVAEFDVEVTTSTSDTDTAEADFLITAGVDPNSV